MIIERSACDKYNVNIGEFPSWVDENKVYDKYRDVTEGEVRFIGELCLTFKRFSDFTKKEEFNYTENPVAVFWQEKPAKPEYSNYFGLYKSSYGLSICDAHSVAEGHWSGILDKHNNEVVFSRFRHDFRYGCSQKFFVDGGRDYFRRGGSFENTEVVNLSIVDGKYAVSKVLVDAY